MNGPDPRVTHPMSGFPRVCFIKNTVKSPYIQVGDYSYFDDPVDSEDFERNVLYHYPEHYGDKLIIGKFCAIASGVQFIMNGANHMLAGHSTFPFQIFGHGWERVMPTPAELPQKGDTIIGNDVWLGYRSVVLPGVSIGHGAIVAAFSVVSRDVPPYTVVGGNPARVLRTRFSAGEIERLIRVAWWDWDADRITRNLEAIVGADLSALEQSA